MGRAALRYAKAVLSLAQDQKTTEVVNDDMKLIVNTVAQSKDLSDVLNSPVVSDSVKKAALLEIFKGINALTVNAVATLITNKRIAMLPEVAKQYSVLFDKSNGTEAATVTTTLPLSDALKLKVLAKAKELTGKEVAVKCYR
jgi:F-type H+-transporting ATPase subunit delta